MTNNQNNKSAKTKRSLFNLKKIFQKNKTAEVELNQQTDNREVWSNKIDFFLSSLGYSGI